jgi:hypothetical protein
VEQHEINPEEPNFTNTQWRASIDSIIVHDMGATLDWELGIL